ncbi:hypothetical protein PoB_002178200 [Plakobranchus ocellatus]|uniref:Uncharacterized protein n=1 Tax=Plakobranchus ocellatus TaxID=259542 RepID=A0AAV3ZL13_9GAST|nr:hypothetical protein PoB_002178200 [Plakobranchus ocellatus]
MWQTLVNSCGGQVYHWTLDTDHYRHSTASSLTYPPLSYPHTPYPTPNLQRRGCEIKDSWKSIRNSRFMIIFLLNDLYGHRQRLAQNEITSFNPDVTVS